MARTTYTVTIGGDSTHDLTAPRADRLAREAARCGLPFTVCDNDGDIVDFGNGPTVRIDFMASEVYAAALSAARIGSGT